MKISSVLLVAVILFLSSCGNAPQSADNARAADSIRAVNDERNLNETLKKLDVPLQVFSAPGNEVSLIRGKKGTVIFLSPTELQTEDGQPVSASIDVELKELNTQAELVRANAQTTSNGALLVSGGAYYINLTSGGKQLKIKEGKDLKVAFPRITDSTMKLFYGERDSMGMMNWLPTNEALTSKNGYSLDNSDTGDSKSIMVYNSKSFRLMGYVGNDSTLRKDTAALKTMKREAMATAYIEKRFKDSIYNATRKPIIEASNRLTKSLYDITNIKKLGWANIDNLEAITSRTNITYTIDPKDSVTVARIYLIYKDINSTRTEMYFNNEINGTRALNYIPVGFRVRLLAVTNRNDELLVCKMDLTTVNDQHTLIKWKKASPEELNSYFDVKNNWGQ